MSSHIAYVASRRSDALSRCFLGGSTACMEAAPDMFSAISCTRTAEIVYKSDPQLAPPCPMGSDAGHWLQQLLLIPPGASTLPARQQLIPDSLACTSLPSPSFASSQPLAVSQRSSPLEGALPSSGRRSMVTSSVTQPRLMDAIADASSLQVRKGRRNI